METLILWKTQNTLRCLNSNKTGKVGKYGNQSKNGSKHETPDSWDRAILEQANRS